MGSVAIPSGIGGGRVGDWTYQTINITDSDSVGNYKYKKNITCEVGDLILLSSNYGAHVLSSYSGMDIINGGVGKEATLAQATSTAVTVTVMQQNYNQSNRVSIVVFHLNNHRNYDFTIVRASGSAGSGSPQNFTNLKLGDIIASAVGSTGGMGDIKSYNCGLVADNKNACFYLAFKETAKISFSSDYTSRLFVVCRPK